VFKPGQQIQELQIAKELNVSRSPVRSAINKLIGEGLLVSHPNRYVCVRQISEKDILDAYEFRLIIESYAIRKTIEKIDQPIREKLEEFRNQFLQIRGEEQIDTYIEIDQRFHSYIIETSGNSVVEESLHKVEFMIMPFRIISLTSRKRFEQSIGEHLGIIDGILNHDAEYALQTCKKHLTLAKEEFLRHIRKTGL
jgi:DNA-binding GntR family transcriptional regulator